jgi:signal transduction histidine kinase
MKLRLAGGLDDLGLIPTAFVALLILAIFSLDLTTDSRIAVSALYVVVILACARLYDRSGVILASATCIALTILNCIMNSRRETYTGLVNSGIGVLVIGLTSYLVLKVEVARRSARNLAEAKLLRDALIGSVSHELRTPLASILGGASVLTDAEVITKDPRLSVVAYGVRDEAERLNNDIQNLLDAARITSDGLQARRDWTDVTDVVNAVLQRIRKSSGDLRLKVSYDRDLPLLYIDACLIEQALGQIVANAIKFSPASSTIRINAATEDQQVVITVSDEGVGLNAQEKLRLTERFFRGSRHSGNIPGSGLGLWIASTFIASNGGTFEALSQGEHCGTTIRITFAKPADQQDREKPRHRTPELAAESKLS